MAPAKKAAPTKAQPESKPEETTQPVDTEAELVPAHPVDEDPEQHIGEELNDPWDDETQPDWVGGVVELPEVKN